MIIERHASLPRRSGLDWDELWSGPDDGVIAAWEAGRDAAQALNAEAVAARRGALPELPWKGGAKPLKAARHWGSLLYLAMWQGLRGDDLCIDLAQEVTLTCADTSAHVTYTADRRRWAQAT